MSNITISLPEDRMSKLREMASGLGTTPEELVRARKSALGVTH